MTTDAVRRRARRVVAALLVISAAALAASASGPQEKNKHPDLRKEYALIFGTVWSADNRPAYGVTVKVRRADEKKARWELTSDHRGEFALRVPPGQQDYVLWADVKVGKGKAKPETTAHVENDERVDVSLHLTE